jgi:hypothetical protein
MKPARPHRFEALRIVLLGLGSAVLFGIAHDQVTARICPEYFTIGHPDLGMPSVFHSPSPTILAFGWGLVATWWVGLPLGVLLAICARVGRWPKLASGQMLRPILVLLGVMACCAALWGTACGLSGMGYYLESVPKEARTGFAIDGCAHRGSYLSGLVGAVVLCALTLVRRRRLSRGASS